MGEEKSDYTIKYNFRDEKASITIYEYEGVPDLIRAKDAELDDAMKKSTVYTKESIAADEYNADGTLTDGEDGLTDDPTRISETFYHQ